ncbi:hypothetical protein [Kribbella sp. DT2]|uniref:hypothetical protein n=1 Tax=Kribbella sp. DT2 TaxID=3393427 RepID=UPI003CE989E4
MARSIDEDDGPVVSDDGEKTEDGRYLIVSGRRWRAADPAIPESLRRELVSELMAARRLVRDDPEVARPRVQDAKVALGERGDPGGRPLPMADVHVWRRPSACCCAIGLPTPPSAPAMPPGSSEVSRGVS